MRRYSDSLLVLGSSRTTLAKVSSDGTSVSTITFSPTIPCTTPNNFVVNASGYMYISCSGATSNIHKYQIVDNVAVGTSTGSIGTSGPSTIAFHPNGDILVNRSVTLYRLDQALSLVSTFALSASPVYLSTDGFDYVYYLTAARVLRKYSLLTSVDTSIKTFSTGTSAKGLFTATNGTSYYLDATDGISKTATGAASVWKRAFSNAASMDIDSSGNIYVINTSGVISVYKAINAPASFSVTASGSNAELTWVSNVSDSDYKGLTVRRSTSSFPALPTDGTSVTTDNLTTSFTDSSLADGTYYYTAFNRTIDDYYSIAATGSVLIDPAPSPVTGLTATSSGASVTLGWTNPSDGDLSAVRIRRSAFGAISGINDGSMVTSESNIAQYVDTGLTDDTYYYGVFAKDAGGNYSVVTTATVTVDTTGPSTPSLSAIGGAGGVNLSWDSPATTNSFIVRRSTVSSPSTITSGSSVGTFGSSTISYEDSGLSAGTYYYSVFALDSFGNASNAGTASATVTAAASSSGSGGGGGGGSASWLSLLRQSTPAVAASPATHPGAAATPAATSSPNTTPPAVTVHTQLKTRTCTRVLKWYGHSGSGVLGRLNARLQKAFGFDCKS